MKNNKLNNTITNKLLASLLEISITDIEDQKSCVGSSHTLKTCKIKGDMFFVKFGADNLFDDINDANIQVGVEYLAYSVYKLYPGVDIPKSIHVVSDAAKGRVGLATQAVKGSGGSSLSPRTLAKLLTAGVFVDVFIANWDIANMSNVIVTSDQEKAVRIDPGGALTFRAQGGRKGSKFNVSAGELKTMLHPSYGGAGYVFQYADLAEAARTFMPVPWSSVEAALKEAGSYVATEFANAGLSTDAWEEEVANITSILKVRHAVVTKHCEFVLGQ